MPEEGIEMEERENDFMWFDKNGIICSVPKEKQVSMTIEDANKNTAEFDKKYGRKLRCMITVVNPHSKSTREQREWAAEVFPLYVKALGIVNDSALGRMAINLFVGLRPPSYPLKVFKDSESAKQWLQQYLDDE